MSLTIGKAKKWMLEHFNRGTDVISVYPRYDEDEYLNVLNAIEKYLPFDKPKYDFSSRLFLYAGCLKFNRWVAPSPIIVHDGLADKFASFVTALKRVERGNPDNVSTFLLHQVRYDLFSSVESIPLGKIEAKAVHDLQSLINEIPSPTNRTKLEEFLREKNDIDAILSGILDGSFRTRISTQIPYIVHLQPIRVNFSWQGIATTVTFSPTFFEPNSVAKLQPAGQPVGPSRWQSGVTDVILEFSALIDGDAWTPSLLSIDFDKLPFNTLPYDGWPKCFTIAFSITHDLVWLLRLKHDGEKQWVPVPRDFTKIECEFRSSLKERLDWKLKGSPGALLKGFSPSDELRVIELEGLESIKWHERCRSLATMYLEIGETNEALFWLNVGVEALFQARFREISKALNKPDLEADLESSKAFWDLAKDVVRQQFPEIVDKIDWPETEAHVSMYKRIKYLYKLVPMKTSIRETLSHYSKVSKYRNALFHGTSEARLAIPIVDEALASFDWLELNFVLET